MAATVTLVALMAWVGLADSKYAGGSSSAAVVFGPKPSGTITVKSIDAMTDTLGGGITIYARSQSWAGKLAPVVVPASNATTIVVANTFGNAGYMTTNDLVVYVHKNGILDYRTISSCTTTTIVLSSGITWPGAAGDYVYELENAYEIEIGGYGTGSGTNDYYHAAGDLFISPGGSPVRVAGSGTTTCKVAVTVSP